MKKKHPGGRPEIFKPETTDVLCEMLSQGMSLRSVCKQEGMPSIATVFKWMRLYPEFLKQYEKAKQESADAMAEELLDIADDGSNDWMQRNYGEEVSWVTNGEAIQRSRLRIDARKWLMAKMKPKKYGEKVDVTSGDKPLLGNTVIFKNFDSVDETDSQ